MQKARTAPALLCLCAAMAAPAWSETVLSSPTRPGSVPVMAQAQADGEWLTYRRDGTLQARSPLRGDIRQPSVAWRRFVGTVGTLARLQPAGADSTLRVPLPERRCEEDAQAVRDRPGWGLAPPAAPLAGGQRPERDWRSVYADLLPERPGLERIVFENVFEKPVRDGKWADTCVAARYWDGQWKILWETPPMPWIFIPQPIAGDFDGDGRLEIAFLPWRKLVTLDAVTGAVKDECTFQTAEAGCGRCYGFLGAYDLDGDGRLEFVVLADFSKHVDVLGYRNGRLTLLWQENIELEPWNVRRLMRVHPDPVADVDADGQLEIVVSLFNRADQGRWRVRIYEARTGRIKAEIEDERLRGLADLNGDGVPELLTEHADGRCAPEFGSVRAWRMRGERAEKIWERAQAAWQIRQRPLPMHVNSFAVRGREDVLWREVNGAVLAVLRAPAGGDDVRITVESWGDGGLQPRMSACGPGLRAEALDETGALLVSCETDPGAGAELTFGSAAAEPLLSFEKGTEPGSVLVVRPQPGEAPLLVAQGCTDRVTVLRSAAPGSAPEEQGRIRGRGKVRAWAKGVPLGVEAADLAGDGTRRLLLASAAPQGCARLRSVRPDGREDWHHDIAHIPGGPTIWLDGGITAWQTGHFTDRTARDVLVTVRRAMHHSDETLLLSGRDGRRIWHRDQRILAHVTDGVGGTPFALLDADGDGLEDAAGLWENLFHVLRGATGADLALRFTAWDEIPGGAQNHVWSGFAVGVEAGAGRIFFATERASLTGLLNLRGDLLWWDAHETSPRALPAFGDFTGRGRLEAVGIGYPDGIRCYDAETGVIRWALPFTEIEPGIETASADVDGDGRDEAVFTAGRTLWCVGSGPDGTAGAVKWRLDLPARLGPPCIADADGSGRASILVLGADAYVYHVTGDGSRDSI